MFYKDEEESTSKRAKVDNDDQRYWDLIADHIQQAQDLCGSYISFNKVCSIFSKHFYLLKQYRELSLQR